MVDKIKFYHYTGGKLIVVQSKAGELKMANTRWNSWGFVPKEQKGARKKYERQHRQRLRDLGDTSSGGVFGDSTAAKESVTTAVVAEVMPTGDISDT